MSLQGNRKWAVSPILSIHFQTERPSTVKWSPLGDPSGETDNHDPEAAVLCRHCLVPGTERELDADGWAVPEDPLHLGAPQPGQSSSVDSYQLITRPQSSSARGPTARHPSHQDSAPLHSRLQPELSLSLVQNNLSTPTSMRRLGMLGKQAYVR